MKLFKRRQTPAPDDARALDDMVKVLQGGAYHFPAGDEPTVNMTRRVYMNPPWVKADVGDDGLTVYGVNITDDGNRIHGATEDGPVFEVSKRSKLYQELQEFAGHQASRVSIYPVEGQYGPAFKVYLLFHVVAD